MVIGRRSLLLAGVAFPVAARAQCVTDTPAVDACLGGARSFFGGPPSLDLSFMTPGSLDGRITFTRASTATYFDVTGTLQTATANTPRWDYDPVTHALRGLLMEDARTNLLLNSATLTTQSVAVTAQAYTLSFYGAGTVALSGTSTGSLVGTGAFPARASLTFTPTAGTLTCTVTGTVQNAQLEAGSITTSYILTAGAAATRAVELAVMSTTPWINQPASTLESEIIVPYPAGFTYCSAELDDGTTLNMLGLRLIAPANVNAFSFIANALAGQVNAATFIPYTVIKAAVAANNQTLACASAVNGGAVASFSLSGAVPTLTRLSIGSGRAAAINGWMRRIRYWPRVMGVGELQSVTT